MPNLDPLLERIRIARDSVPVRQSALIAISGIDGCGKGFVTERVVRELRARGMRVASINVDGWLDLPARRFNPRNPAEHFYLNAIRFDDMLGQLVLPLREHRSIRCEADYAEETASSFRKYIYDFEDIDVIALEGIFLLKGALRHHYDLSCWIECSFETALDRAVDRAQEGMSAEQTVEAYRTIYFPAQEIHFQRDRPQNAATLCINNDPALSGYRPDPSPR